MEDYLGPVKSKPELFLKLVKKVSRPEYTMHFMEDRNGRKAMFYNYKGVKIEEGECALLKGTISEHRRSKFDNGKPLTYINRVTIIRNMGSKEEPKIDFGEIDSEKGSAKKTWQVQLSEEEILLEDWEK